METRGIVALMKTMQDKLIEQIDTQVEDALADFRPDECIKALLHRGNIKHAAEKH